jgi:phosphopantetheinyl transferase
LAKLYLAHCELNGCSGHDAGRQLLGQLFDTHVGGEMPEIFVAEGGKPYFSAGDWHFSISHTKRHAFCALSDAPIGIDAEEADRNIDLRLADKILSPAERARFEVSTDKQQALLRLWVLKEAAAKFSGKGLRGYPNHTDFDPNDSRIQSIDGCYIAILQEDDHAI